MITIFEVSRFYISGLINPDESVPRFYSALLVVAEAPADHWEPLAALEPLAEQFQEYQEKGSATLYGFMLQQMYPRTEKPDSIARCLRHCQKNGIRYSSAEEMFCGRQDAFVRALKLIHIKISSDAYVRGSAK